MAMPRRRPLSEDSADYHDFQTPRQHVVEGKEYRKTSVKRRGGSSSTDGEVYMNAVDLEDIVHQYQRGVLDDDPLNKHIHPKKSHPSIAENHKYTFAIILRSPDKVAKHLWKTHKSIPAGLKTSFPSLVAQAHEKCLRRLILSGLGITILKNSPEFCDEICLLVDPHKNATLLFNEFKREKDELAMKRGEANSELCSESSDDPHRLRFSPVLEIQLTQNIIRNAFIDYDRMEWESFNGELAVHDVIEDIFPLHDQEFNRKFFDEYRRHTFIFSTKKAITGNSERWAIEELRLHFGERVAFLFAFMHLYTKFLAPITLLGLSYYIFTRFYSFEIWRYYMRGLSIIGFGIAAVWAPSFLVFWHRETNTLITKWNLAGDGVTVYEKNDENPGFQFRWSFNQTTGEMEKTPKRRYRWLIRSSMAIFVLISALLQCILIFPFIQWYVFAKQAPTCSACHDEVRQRTQEGLSRYTCIRFLTCFNSSNSLVGTDRWLYILCQGILLGLTIDIFLWSLFNWLSAKLVSIENYEKKSEFEERLVNRRFFFVWSNWFFWFLFLAFVYLPFGDTINEVVLQKALRLGILSVYDWNPRILVLDELFVTPLVVTQLLNLLLETVVPYIIRRCSRNRTRVRTKKKPNAMVKLLHKIWSTFLSTKEGGVVSQRIEDARLIEEERKEVNYNLMSADRLALKISEDMQFYVPVLDQGDDSNGYSAADIVAESKLPVFDPMDDYLDAVIQFSYVVMFTVVWPLCPLPAFINNLLEVRGDAFRLLFTQRRPMPRRDTSIGGWLTVLYNASCIGVIVVAGLIFVYHYGYFISACNFTFDSAVFVPFREVIALSTDPECRSAQFNYTFQIVAFVLLEHLGLLIRYLVLQMDNAKSKRHSTSEQQTKELLRIQSIHAASGSQFEFLVNFRKVFNKHRIDHSDFIDSYQLLALIADWFQLGKEEEDRSLRSYESLQPYRMILFRYMDKNKMGRLSFSNVALQLYHMDCDRFLTNILGMTMILDSQTRDECFMRTESSNKNCLHGRESIISKGRRSSAWSTGPFITDLHELKSSSNAASAIATTISPSYSAS